jgi:hypothetical protein
MVPTLSPTHVVDSTIRHPGVNCSDASGVAE